MPLVSNIKALKLSQAELVSLFVFFIVFIVGIFSFFPGAMTWDSLDQLRQARAGEYSNWQPPIMAILWNQFLALPYGEGGMLVFHLVCLYLSCLVLFFWAKQRQYKARFLFLLMPVLPWVINFEFTIWKDVGLAYTWLLSAVLVFCCKPQTSARKIILLATVFILFLYGLLVRSNALFGAFALLPFLIMCSYKSSLIKTILISLFTVVILFFTVPKLVLLSFNVTPQNNLSYIMLDDVVALRTHNDSFFSKEEVLQIEQCDIRERNKVGVAFCLEEKFLFVKDEGYPQLKAEWLKRIQEQPLQYIKYRLSAFSSLLRSPSVQPYYPSEFRVRQAPYFHESPVAEKSMFINRLDRHVNFITRSIPFLYKPYFWVVLGAALALILFKLRQFNPYPVYLLPVSGLMYLFAYLLTTPFPDFRYVYWTCIIVTFSLLIAVCLWEEKTNAIQYIKPEEE